MEQRIGGKVLTHFDAWKRLAVRMAAAKVLAKIDVCKGCPHGVNRLLFKLVPSKSRNMSLFLALTGPSLCHRICIQNFNALALL